jgi:hypothetical protein
MSSVTAVDSRVRGLQRTGIRSEDGEAPEPYGDVARRSQPVAAERTDARIPRICSAFRSSQLHEGLNKWRRG